MDHDGAIQSQAVERYMLGTMSSQERDDFEDHYFGCPECADEVRLAARFRANAREVFRGQSAAAVKKERWSWFRFPIFGPITVAFALLLTYQNAFQIPSLKNQLRTRSFPSFALHTVRRSGDTAEVRIPANVPEFGVYFDVPAGPGSYEITVVDGAGKAVDRFAAAAPAGGEPLNLHFHRSDLEPGPYTLNVRAAGAPGSWATEFKFTLE
jgi:hypothetical protein